MFVARCKTGATKAGSVRAKRSARDHRHSLRFKQTNCKFFLAHSCHRYGRECIERPARQMALEPNLIESAHDVIPTTMILVAHGFHSVFAALQRFDGGLLAQD